MGSKLTFDEWYQEIRKAKSGSGGVKLYHEDWEWQALFDLLGELKSYRTYFTPEARRAALEAVARCGESQSACRTLRRDQLPCEQACGVPSPGGGVCPHSTLVEIKCMGSLAVGTDKCPYYRSPNCCPVYNAGHVDFRKSQHCPSPDLLHWSSCWSADTRCSLAPARVCVDRIPPCAPPRCPYVVKAQ